MLRSALVPRRKMKKAKKVAVQGMDIGREKYPCKPLNVHTGKENTLFQIIGQRSRKTELV